MNNLTTKIVATKSLLNLGLNLEFFNTLADKVLNNKGFTCDLKGKEPENKRYIVSLKGFEAKSANLTKEGILFTLLKYVYYHQEKLQVEGNYLGAWVEGNYLVLDISQAFSERYKESIIIDFCKENEQRAYFDLYKKEAVFVK